MNGHWTPRRRTSFAGIKGLTGEAVVPRLPTIGRLRKGDSEEITTKSGKKAKRPIDLDHFRFTASREGDDGKRIVAAFRSAYGDAPRALDVYLPYPEPTENFQTAMEEWVAGGLKHRCDGETMTMWQGENGVYHEDPRPCPYYGHPELRTAGDPRKGIPPNPGCREVGRLNVLLPALVQAGYVGTVTLVTTSINDIIAISAALQAVAEEQQRNMDRADLRGILFTLRRVPEMISTPGADGKRVRRAKWLVVIEPAVAWVQMQLQMARQAALPQLVEPAWQPQPPDWEDVTSNSRPVAEVEGEATELASAPGFAEAEEATAEVDDVPLEPPPPPTREQQARALWGRLWAEAQRQGWQESNLLLLEKMGYSGLLQLLDFALARGEEAVTGQMLDVVRPWPEEVITAGLAMKQWPDRADLCAVLHQSGFFRDTAADVLIDWLSSTAHQETGAAQPELFPAEVEA